MSNATLLIELLTEELPPKALPRLGETFAGKIAEGLKNRAWWPQMRGTAVLPARVAWR